MEPLKKLNLSALTKWSTASGSWWTANTKDGKKEKDKRGGIQVSDVGIQWEVDESKKWWKNVLIHLNEIKKNSKNKDNFVKELKKDEDEEKNKKDGENKNLSVEVDTEKEKDEEVEKNIQSNESKKPLFSKIPKIVDKKDVDVELNNSINNNKKDIKDIKDEYLWEGEKMKGCLFLIIQERIK